ncbi:hypothetical protein DC347_16300 [Pseudarthrobacter sp. AG30]|nr:hypothetical protein DC347_16300 [Pseudarthrobacter sp. AG30]
MTYEFRGGFEIPGRFRIQGPWVILAVAPRSLSFDQDLVGGRAGLLGVVMHRALLSDSRHGLAQLDDLAPS